VANAVEHHGHSLAEEIEAMLNMTVSRHPMRRLFAAAYVATLTVGVAA
jgi:hypothetical protein